jgi:hypothetical protein
MFASVLVAFYFNLIEPHESAVNELLFNQDGISAHKLTRMMRQAMK